MLIKAYGEEVNLLQPHSPYVKEACDVVQFKGVAFYCDSDVDCLELIGYIDSDEKAPFDMCVPRYTVDKLNRMSLPNLNRMWEEESYIGRYSINVNLAEKYYLEQAEMKVLQTIQNMLDSHSFSNVHNGERELACISARSRRTPYYTHIAELRSKITRMTDFITSRHYNSVKMPNYIQDLDTCLDYISKNGHLTENMYKIFLDSDGIISCATQTWVEKGKSLPTTSEYSEVRIKNGNMVTSEHMNIVRPNWTLTLRHPVNKNVKKRKWGLDYMACSHVMPFVCNQIYQDEVEWNSIHSASYAFRGHEKNEKIYATMSIGYKTDFKYKDFRYKINQGKDSTFKLIEEYDYEKNDYYDKYYRTRLQNSSEILALFKLEDHFNSLPESVRETFAGEYISSDIEVNKKGINDKLFELSDGTFSTSADVTSAMIVKVMDTDPNSRQMHGTTLSSSEFEKIMFDYASNSDISDDEIIEEVEDSKENNIIKIESHVTIDDWNGIIKENEFIVSDNCKHILPKLNLVVECIKNNDLIFKMDRNIKKGNKFKNMINLFTWFFRSMTSLSPVVIMIDSKITQSLEDKCNELLCHSNEDQLFDIDTFKNILKDTLEYANAFVSKKTKYNKVSNDINKIIISQISQLEKSHSVTDILTLDKITPIQKNT
jgi:hypothetical protein